MYNVIRKQNERAPNIRYEKLSRHMPYVHIGSRVRCAFFYLNGDRTQKIQNMLINLLKIHTKNIYVRDIEMYTTHIFSLVCLFFFVVRIELFT